MVYHNKRCEFAKTKGCQCSCKGELHGKGNKKAEPIEIIDSPGDLLLEDFEKANGSHIIENIKEV